MAKRKTDPKDWFVTQQEFAVMLYAIANDYNHLKARVTLLESSLPEKPASV